MTSAPTPPDVMWITAARLEDLVAKIPPSWIVRVNPQTSRIELFTPHWQFRGFIDLQNKEVVRVYP